MPTGHDHANTKPPGGGKDHEPKPGTHSDADLKKAKRLVREMRRQVKSPCNRPPARPNARFFTYAHEARIDLHFTGRLRWDDVKVDTSGYPITIDRWEAIIVACDASGTPQDTDVETPTHPLTAATTTGTIATFTISDTHQYDAGDVIQVSGVTPAAYNGYWVVLTTPTSSKFTADIGTSPVNGSAFGTAQKTSGMHVRRSLKMTPTFISVKTATAASSVATFTMQRQHHFEVGDKVIVLGMTPGAYNGIWRVASVPANDTWTANIGSSPINATVTGRAVEVEDQELEVQVPGELPRPRVWYWKGRVRCRSTDGCWSAWSAWTSPKLPWTGSNPKPPTPTFGVTPITFSTLGKGRDAKIRLHFTYNEVGNFDIPGGDHQDDTDKYVVQLDRSDDGVTWDGAPTRTEVYQARDADADSTRTAIFQNIRRRYWYRCRVRTIDRFNRRGDWSAWSNPALPFDDNRPPGPINVETWDVSTDRVAVAWDDPTINVEVRGTASVTNGSASVTGSGTKWQAEVDEGTVIAFAGAPTTQYTVKRVTSDTAMTLTTNYGETTNGSRKVFVVDDDPDVAFYEVQIAKASQVDTSTTPDTYNAIYAKSRARGTRVNFKVADSDKTNRFYARVRSVDAAHNRSQWIPAWKRSAHGGAANSSAAVDADDSGIATPVSTDGSAPASSPAANAAGFIGYISVYWSPVTNADPFFYDVHISTVSGFTPSTTTLVLSAPSGTEAATILRYNDGTALVAGTNYYVKIVARDGDGPAAAGAQAGPVTVKTQVSDGIAPTGTTPTPFLSAQGDFIRATWATMSNPDPMSYEVHVSTTAGFTPSSTTLYAVVDASSTTTGYAYATITRLPPMTSGGSVLVPGTTYRVRIVGRDYDGPATASAESAIVAPGLTSDGSAPSASPAVTRVDGGVGFVAAYWTPLIIGAPRDATHNPDPTTYEVWAGTTNPPTNKVGEVDGGSFFIRTINGTALIYGTTYYVGIKARDADGTAAMGTVNSAKMIPVNSPDINTNAVTANAILAGTITADKLVSNFVMGKKIVASSFGATGWDSHNRVEIDGTAGISLVLDDGTNESYPVRLPLDGTPATFKGGVDANDLTVSGTMVLNGQVAGGDVSQISPGAQVQLQGGIQTPIAPPAATPTWASQRVATDSDTQLRYRGLDYSTTGGAGGTTAVYYTAIRDLDTDNWQVYELLASTMAVNRVNPDIHIAPWEEIIDVAHAGTTIFYLVHSPQVPGSAEWWNVFAVSAANFGTVAASFLFDPTTRVNNAQPGLFYDGTNLIVLTTSGTGGAARIRLAKFTTAGVFASNSDLDSAVTVSAPNTELYGGGLVTNSGATAYWLGMYDSTQPTARNHIYGFNNSTLVEVPSSRFDNPDASGGSYVTYDTTNGRFISMKESGQGSMWRHTDAFAYTSTVNPVWFGYTWYDSNATGSQHETTVSTKIVGVTWPRRAYMNVTWPSPPALVGTDGVDNTRVYALPNATAPVSRLRSAWQIQATIANPGNGTTLSALASSNGTDTLGAFPTSTPGQISHQAGGSIAPLQGSGDGFMPVGSIMPFAGSANPVGWLICDGTAVSRTTYANLFAICGTAFGIGDGSTTFNLPDLRSRVPIGAGTFRARAANDGLAEASRDTGHTHGTGTYNINQSGSAFGNTNLSGGGALNGGVHAHNNANFAGVSGAGGGAGIFPSLGLVYIIKT